MEQINQGIDVEENRKLVVNTNVMNMSVVVFVQIVEL